MVQESFPHLPTSFHIFPLARHCTDVFAAPPATVLGPVARWPLAFLARAGPSREAGAFRSFRQRYRAFRTHQYLWVKLNTRLVDSGTQRHLLQSMQLSGPKTKGRNVRKQEH